MSAAATPPKHAEPGAAPDTAIGHSCDAHYILAVQVSCKFGDGGRVAATVEDIEAWLGRSLPEPYRSFLAATPHHYLAGDRTLVYGLDDVVERNETYQSREYCPGHLMVGDDSGGSAVVLSLAGGALHRVGMGAMTEDCFEPVARDFAEWASRGFALPDE